ncbi:hypothetical protein X759_30675 [Mesorhizobium sp. LSHC420B00]|nr:hypothetical protein X759_30675 [Mesorhizobium sp. LSHC420B00]
MRVSARTCRTLGNERRNIARSRRNQGECQRGCRQDQKAGKQHPSQDRAFHRQASLGLEVFRPSA